MWESEHCPTAHGKVINVRKFIRERFDLTQCIQQHIRLGHGQPTFSSYSHVKDRLDKKLQNQNEVKGEITWAHF